MPETVNEVIGNVRKIHSVSDFFKFRLSMKALIVIFLVCIIFGAIIFILLMGGVKNAVEFVIHILKTTQENIIFIKNNKQQLNMKKGANDAPIIKEE
jgi:Na+/proline symporter